MESPLMQAFMLIHEEIYDSSREGYDPVTADRDADFLDMIAAHVLTIDEYRELTGEIPPCQT